MHPKLKTVLNYLFLGITVFALFISPWAFVRSYDQMDRLDWSLGVISWFALAVYTVFFVKKLVRARVKNPM
jgi:O-antigen/teichoic acid export membrane protein